MPLGTIWGIRLRLNPLFLLFFALWFFTGMAVEAGILCAVVLIHELAHALVARRWQLRVREIELYPFGGVARIDEQLELEPHVERRLALAGPAANLALAGAGIVLLNRTAMDEKLLLFFLQSNLVLACFNLLPALPLDGGRILRSYLAPLADFRWATEQAARAGQFLAVLLCAWGAVSWFYRPVNPSLILVGVFLYLAAGRERRQAIYTFLRSLGVKERELFRRGGLHGEYLVVLEETSLLDIFRLFAPQRYHFIRVLDRSQRLRGELTEKALVKAAMQKGLDIPVKKIL